VHRALELSGDLGVAAGEEVDERGREAHAERGHRQQQHERQTAHGAKEALRRVFALALAHLHEHRQHGILHGAFGEQLPEHVRNRERDEEGVRDRACEDGGDGEIAQEAEQPAGERTRGHDARAPGDVPGLAHAFRF
jgi:hypothetical protein